MKYIEKDKKRRSMTDKKQKQNKTKNKLNYMLFLMYTELYNA